MSRTRMLIAAPGLALILYGVVRLLLEVPFSQLFALFTWLIGSVVLHDFVFSPAVVGVGALLARVLPARARRYVQAALIAGGLVAVIALPMILRQGSQPRVKAILLRDYSVNLLILLALITATAIALYLVQRVRGDRTPTEPDVALPQ